MQTHSPWVSRPWGFCLRRSPLGLVTSLYPIEKSMVGEINQFRKSLSGPLTRQFQWAYHFITRAVQFTAAA